MRIHLKTPFAEKDAAKALGARWDGTRKLWYITDVADLTPFLRWIPDLEAARQDGADGSASDTTAKAKPAEKSAAKASAQATAKSTSGVTTRPATVLPHCGCTVLPWLDCQHSTA
jgi:hypothetical protein